MSEETPVQENTAPIVGPAIRMVGNLAPLFAAIAEATGKFQHIQKDRHVKIQTRDRGTYEFDYATLEEVLRCTTPALAACGLKLWHFLCDGDDGNREIHHILSHASGAFIETVQELPRTERWQEFGSAITYARRYQVQCMLGVSAEFDDDGNAADGNTVAEHRDRSKAPSPTAPPKAKAPPPEKTRPTSDRPPPPEASDEPCSPATLGEIKKFMLALNIQRTEKIAMMKSVLGKSPEEQPTEEDGQKMLAHLRNLAEADGVVVE